jgi:Mn2+/Fe2+ NRAMP family transporter
MGPLVNRVGTTVAATAISVLIIAMNIILIALLFGG